MSLNKTSLLALFFTITCCFLKPVDAGVIQGETFDYTKFDFTNGNQGFNSHTYRHTYRSRFTGRTFGRRVNTTTWSDGITPLNIFNPNPLVSETGGVMRSLYNPFSPEYGETIQGVPRTGLVVNFESPRIKSNSGRGTLHGTIDFKVNETNDAELVGFGATHAGFQAGAVRQERLKDLGNGWHRMSFTLQEIRFTPDDGNTVKFRFNFNDQVSDLLVDNITISKDVPDLNAPQNLYPIRVDGEVYYIRKGYNNFDGVYDSNGQLRSVSAEVAGKLLQASSALQTMSNYDSSEVSKLLTRAFRNDIIADFSEATRQVLVTAAGSVISSSFNPASTAEGILNSASTLTFVETQTSIRLLTALALEVTDQHLDVVSEARERFLGDQKVVIDFDVLKEVDAHTVRAIESGRALTNMLMANADLPESLAEGIYKSFGDLTLATLGTVGAGASAFAQGAASYEEFVEALESYEQFLNQNRVPATSTSLLDEYMEDAASKIAGNLNNQVQPGQNLVSLEEFWSTFGLSPDAEALQVTNILEIDDETSPTITFGGEGVGSLVNTGGLSYAPAISLTYGSPVSAIIEGIDIPENDFLLSFDYLWSSNDGFLNIFLNDVLLDTLFAPNDVQDGYSRYSIFVLASDFLGIDVADLMFYTDGPTGQRLLISNLSLTELSSSVSANISEVSEPASLLIFALLLVFMRRRSSF